MKPGPPVCEPDAEELQQENQELQDRLHNMEEQLGMVNKASAAVVQNIVLNNTNNLVINVENLNVHNSAGHEDLSHISKLTFQELQKKLSLPHSPQAFAEWCRMVRTDLDEDHPENHTALLLDKDATEMACCACCCLKHQCTHVLGRPYVVVILKRIKKLSKFI